MSVLKKLGRRLRPAPPRYRVLMVCLGNICRSPTAEAVLAVKLAQAGLDERVHVDSAGTHSGHVGSPPDSRAQHHARLRGYDLSRLRARRVARSDFEEFDLLLAMDEANLADLTSMAPPQAPARICLLMTYARKAAGVREVPDPYYGAQAGFERVLDLVEDACDGLVESLAAELREDDPAQA